MKKIFILLLALMLVFLAGCQIQWDLPDFTIYNSKGKEVQLSDFGGKPMIVNFWASWCPPCKAEMPDFQKAYEEYGDQIQFIMINMTTWEELPEDADAFLKSTGYTFPVYYDRAGEAAEAYDIESIPQTLFISAEGKMLGWEEGMISESKLQSYIQKLLP